MLTNALPKLIETVQSAEATLRHLTDGDSKQPYAVRRATHQAYVHIIKAQLELENALNELKQQ